jgi:hypothetical protein
MRLGTLKTLVNRHDLKVPDYLVRVGNAGGPGVTWFLVARGPDLVSNFPVF